MKISHIILAAMVLAILLVGCKKAHINSVDCEKPQILIGNECCLDKNGNGICDADDEKASHNNEETTPGIDSKSQINAEEQARIEERGKIIQEAKNNIPSENELLGYFPDWYDGHQYPLYPSMYYKYLLDDQFKNYNRSIVLDGKQCHITDIRKFIPAGEVHYYWRPLPVPCKETKDCEIYAASDLNLKSAMSLNSIFTCKPYLKGCCE